MQFFFQEFELRTRFVFKNRVEPSQLDFRLTGTDRLQTCFLTFFSLWVELAQPRFWTFGFSLEATGSTQTNQKKGTYEHDHF